MEDILTACCTRLKENGRIVLNGRILLFHDVGGTTMRRAQSIMIQGTHSDAGKSVISTALCRIFSDMGYKTAPFKSQNMALNSYITLDGKEIGRAQGVQAEAARTIATTDMNPILIKPSRDYEAQIVVHGKPYKNMQAGAYRQDFFQQGLTLIKEAYERLDQQFERIVIEGAGSPAEINLNDRELVNMRVANMTESPVILVGDIERGGVFASLVGTLQLIEESDRDRVIGVIINKFRGDVSLLEPGLDWFTEYTGVPVLGVVPYTTVKVDAEDSVALKLYSTERNSAKEIDIAVIQFPKISNFTDIDPFLSEEDCHVRFVSCKEQLQNPDLLILPGSKNTIEDLMFLKQSGLYEEILKLTKNGKTMVFGICGGYQMLGATVEDPEGIESQVTIEDGLKLLPIYTTITSEKTTTLSKGTIQINEQTHDVEGYEIHMGVTTFLKPCTPLITHGTTIDGVISENQQIIGTYFHGIFDNDSYRAAIINQIRKVKGLEEKHGRVSFRSQREKAYDQLADHVKEHINLPYIEEKMREYYEKKIHVEIKTALEGTR
jgi:adenosylcobyric acid synthase